MWARRVSPLSNILRQQICCQLGHMSSTVVGFQALAVATSTWCKVAANSSQRHSSEPRLSRVCVRRAPAILERTSRVVLGRGSATSNFNFVTFCKTDGKPQAKLVKLQTSKHMVRNFNFLYKLVRKRRFLCYGASTKVSLWRAAETHTFTLASTYAHAHQKKKKKNLPRESDICMRGT